MNEEKYDKLLFQMTYGDLKDLLKSILRDETEECKQNLKQEPEYVYGIEQLAAYIGCSESTVNRRIRAGKFESSIIRNGRLLIFDKQEVMEIIKREGWGLAFSKEGGKK